MDKVSEMTNGLIAGLVDLFYWTIVKKAWGHIENPGLYQVQNLTVRFVKCGPMYKNWFLSATSGYIGPSVGPSVGLSVGPSKIFENFEIWISQLWSLIEPWGFREDISPMTKTKLRMIMRRSRTTRMTTRRPSRTTRRRTRTIIKLSSVLPFWNHKLKPN